MNDNWKPGDVVEVISAHSTMTGERGIVTKVTETGTSVIIPGRADCQPMTFLFESLRRLVVIDAEDREQVERLIRLFDREVDGQVRPIEVVTSDIDDMQAALREFANPTPPKPEEPTGLGAVVEDAEGARWVRFESKTGWWWRTRAGLTRRYADITAVRELSEGVTP